MKKHRLDTVKGSQEIVSKIRTIEWPESVPVVEGAIVHFSKIILEKSSSLWTDHEIELAALLAISLKTQIGLEVKQSMGVLDSDERQCLQMSYTRVTGLRRTIGIQDAAKGNPADRKKRNELAQEIEAGLSVNQDEKSLLAKRAVN